MGKLIAIEGISKTGKTHQANMLKNAFSIANIPVALYSFPNYSTPIGQVLKNALEHNIDIPKDSLHMLFAANKYEFLNQIVEDLKTKHVIVDRYIYSGIVYAAADSLDLNFYKYINEYKMPIPDIVIYIDTDLNYIYNRYDTLKFDNIDFQRKLDDLYFKISDQRWKNVDGSDTKNNIHRQILIHLSHCLNIKL